MKNFITICMLLILVSIGGLIHAQVTPSAILDLESTDQGILIPRMTEAKKMAIDTPATSLLIYQTDSTAGYYYYNGINWTILVDGSTTITKLNDLADAKSDNDGSDNGSSIFIGISAGANDDATDNKNVGIGFEALNNNTSGRHNIAMGHGSLMANTTGEANIAIGRDALSMNTIASDNLAVGHRSLQANISGSGNSAFARLALNDNTTGEYNAAFGFYALINNISGNYNTAHGSFALRSNQSGSDNTAIGYQADVTVGNLTNATAIGANTKVSQSNSLILGNNANVGIGTSSPSKAKLEIQGFASDSLGNFGYLNSSGSTGVANGTSPYSIYASDRIAASEFNAHSDRRIKNIKGLSNAESDLATLMEIEVTDYTLIDKKGKGNKSYKKVIAQQVEAVYPQSVSNDLVEVVPDIYEVASIKDEWILLNTDLQIGDRVKLISTEGAGIHEVLEIDNERFKVSNQPQESEVFIYGREVEDFHTVDYEAISMLNVSATQAMFRQLQELKMEVKKVTKLEEEVKKVKQLEQLVLNSQLENSALTQQFAELKEMILFSNSTLVTTAVSNK